MASWPTKTKYISHATKRVDGPAKATGRARYSSDIQAEGWLYGMILRSKLPAAERLCYQQSTCESASAADAPSPVQLENLNDPKSWRNPR